MTQDVRDLIAEAREAMTERDDTGWFWVGRLADALEAAARELSGDGEYILALIETIKKTGGSVEIHGVKIMPCDEYGRTGVERDAALDGAPEPEWEWGYRGETLNDVHTRKSRESAEGAVKDLTEYWALHGKKFELVRRRKAGPWLPVKGESDE